jgi:hypothetical protein
MVMATNMAARFGMARIRWELAFPQTFEWYRQKRFPVYKRIQKLKSNIMAAIVGLKKSYLTRRI